MTPILRLRKHLARDITTPVWPDGTQVLAVSETDPRLLHAILVDAYANGFGNIPPFDDWWRNLTGDSEFDPALVFVAADTSGQPIGVAQCWTPGFIKDIAVIPEWRGKGIGEALLLEAFTTFQRSGLPHVDLKVVSANTPAIRLYRRVGMVDAG